MTHRLPRFAILLALLAAGAVQAQTPSFGVQGGLVLPTADLSSTLDNRMGYALGAHMGLYYGGGHELRPRVELSTFQGGWHPVGGGTFERTNVSSWSLGADYLYFTDMRPTGFYLVMGLGNQWWRVSPEHSPSSSKSAIYVAAGAGYRPDRFWSFEGRFATGTFQDTNGQANQLQAIASFRF